MQLVVRLLLYLKYTCFANIQLMAITVKVIFRPKKNDKNNGNLHIRVTEHRKYKLKALNIEVPLKHWDGKNQKVLPSLKGNYKMLNEKIKQSLDKLEKSNNNIAVLNSTNAVITEYWEHHNTTTINSGTKSNRRANLNKFIAFLHDHNLEGLKFSKLTPHIVELYDKYLTQKLSKNSVNTYIGYFKSVVKKAIKQEIISYPVDPFINHKRITNKNKKARALSVHQVKTLFELKLDNKRDYFRNMFLFQIMGGGLRVRDLICLRWSNIEVNENGFYLHYIQTKTNKEIRTKLSHKALQLLNTNLKMLFPDETINITKILELLNTQIKIKGELESKIKYRKYDTTTSSINEFKHYDSEENKTYRFDEINKTDSEILVSEQKIKILLNNINQEYVNLINKVNSSYSNKFIYNLMDGIELPKNNTNDKVKNKIQGKISIYNYHLQIIAKTMSTPKFTSHTARHTFAQVLVNINTNLFHIQQFLGHSSMGVTQNYVRSLDNGQLDEVAEALANQF